MLPESVLDENSTDNTQTVEFTFDDEVVNSEAYQKAMAPATARSSVHEQKEDVKATGGHLMDGTASDMNSLLLQIDDAIETSNNDESPPYDEDDVKAREDEEIHADILDDLEKSMLPFMPPAPSSRQPSVTATETESTEASQERPSSAMTESSTPAPLAVLITEEPKEIRASADAQDLKPTLSRRSLDATDGDQEDEEPPPLPPRRTASSHQAPAESSSSSEPKQESSWDEIFAPLSTTSYPSLTDPGSEDNEAMRKPLPLVAEKPSKLSSYGTDGKGTTSFKSTGETDPDKIWASIILDEEKYIERMNKFTNIFYGVVAKEWPILEKHMEAIVLARQLVPLHQKYILDVVNEQITQNASSVCDPRLFTTWANKTYKVLKEYSRRYPHALYALRLTRTRDRKFGPSIETIGLNLTYPGKSWEDYLALPIAQLDAYITRLQSIGQWLDGSSTHVPSKEQSRVEATLGTLQRLKVQCSELTDKSIAQEEIQSLHRRVHTVDTSLVNILELTAPIRRIVYQGSLALKLKSRGPWQSMHVVLLDNYIFWGKFKSTKDPQHKGMMADSIRVIEKVSVLLLHSLRKTNTSSPCL
jgi:hypothetical protein